MLESTASPIKSDEAKENVEKVKNHYSLCETNNKVGKLFNDFTCCFKCYVPLKNPFRLLFLLVYGACYFFFSCTVNSFNDRVADAQGLGFLVYVAVTTFFFELIMNAYAFVFGLIVIFATISAVAATILVIFTSIGWCCQLCLIFSCKSVYETK